MTFPLWLESTAPSTWLRESTSLWAFPFVLCMHTFGMAVLAGLNSALALRLLGVAPRVPLAPLGQLFPVMWAGFWINALSGAALLIADAATMMVSWVFWIKMAAIALAIVNLVFIRRLMFGGEARAAMDRNAVPLRVKLLAGTSLLCWTIAMTAGRLTAYLGAGALAKGGL